MSRFVCIHGHFYQPPRENPWLEEVEPQESAAPFRDWNERITAECYDPNRASRILDRAGAIDEIINNYSRISFNFGPTLLSWLQRHSPATHAAIIAADQLSRERFSGHGSALAQAWGHIILPLANSRDQRTQIVWGIRDFTARFNRPPEGMWLPETAVDLATLELLADTGIRFTILSPYQAAATRLLDRDDWHDVSTGTIDTRQPYLCRLPSGRSLAIFFYDGRIARDIAFGQLLDSGEEFARKLTAPFDDTTPAQLVHVATDGESYGHHHRFGDMALAYALRRIGQGDKAQLTIYGEFLERFPPRHEVRIIERSSWSCAHGVERWRSDCGCRIGTNPGWNQTWRAPLRRALDWLRDRLIPLYSDHASHLFTDPWQARDHYIDVVLDRSPQQIERFLRSESGRELAPEETRTALRLLEMQRHAMQMYTSCGWFFDEVSGIETIQLLAYAGRAIHLAEEIAGVRLEDEFRQQLALVPSNKPRWGNAARIYDELVRPARVDLKRAAAHHAIATLFDTGGAGRTYAYTNEDLCRRRVHAGPMELAVGRLRICSTLTRDEDQFAYAVLHYGSHHVTAGVRKMTDVALFDDTSQQLCQVFEGGGLEQTLALLDRHFEGGTYTLSHLFKEEQQQIIKRIIRRQIDAILTSFRTIHADHLALLRFLRGIGMSTPEPLAAVAEQLITDELLRLFTSDGDEPHRVRQLLTEAETLGLDLEPPPLAYAASGQSRRLLAAVAAHPDQTETLHRAVEGLRLLGELPWPIDLWHAQNHYLELQPHFLSGHPARDPQAKLRQDLFLQLGRLLNIRVGN